MDTAIRKMVENTIGYSRRQTKNEWFYEECEAVYEKKNALRVRVIQKNTRTTNIVWQGHLRHGNLLRRKKNNSKRGFHFQSKSSVYEP
jgi:hypothetical protein